MPKPTNATTPSVYFTYNPAVLYNGFYGVAEIQPLDKWRHHAAEAAAQPGSRYAAIVEGAGGTDSLVAIQLAAIFRGKFVWAPRNQFGLTITNFDQDTYDLL